MVSQRKEQKKEQKATRKEKVWNGTYCSLKTPDSINFNELGGHTKAMHVH